MIEGIAVNTIASRNDVLLIGPNQINAVQGLLTAFKPGEIKNLNDIYKYFDGIVNAVKAAGASYDEAHQIPNSIAYGCLWNDSSSCKEAVYDDGFNSVYKCSGFCLPSPVIVMIHNLDTGQWAWNKFLFYPLN